MQPHEVLGVAPGAGPDEIRRGFRTFARRHHPDRGGDPHRFQQGVDAYRRLLGDDAPAPPNVVFHRRRRGWQHLVGWRRPRRHRVT